MKFVLDTNIILKALIRDSTVRAILLGPNHQFLIPEHGIEETRKHMLLIVEKSGVSETEVNVILDILLINIQVIPSEDILAKWEEAREIMSRVDMGDVPFVAAALSLSCDGIWSDDEHLSHQTKVKIWRTKDVVGLDSRA